SAAHETDRVHIDVADVADAPALGRRARKQRDEESRAPSRRGRRAHPRPVVQSKYPSTGPMPSANTSFGGRRLTTRNDSRGKSKKNPGCSSTPSCVSNRTTRSSSGSREGTCSTAYHPPSLVITRHDGTAEPIVASAP